MSDTHEGPVKRVAVKIPVCACDVYGIHIYIVLHGPYDINQVVDCGEGVVIYLSIEHILGNT